MRIFKKTLIILTVLLALPQIIEISTEPIASEQIADSQQPISED